MNCELWQDKIDAFVDAELLPAQARAFEEHLRSCNACSAETLARHRLKVQVRTAGARYTPTPEFESLVLRQTSRRSFRLTSWVPSLAAAAAIVVVLFGGLLWRQSLLQREFVAQLVDQHVAMLASSNPVDVISTDSHTVKPWFGGKVPFSVDIPDLQGTQFNLIGGSLSYFQQAPAAHLIFGIRKHKISVFMFREQTDTAVLGSQATPTRRGGFQTETWTEDGIRYFAVSDVAADDVRTLCELLKKSDRS